jgi:phospholipid/cholesterol/gamma-HCH transport system permease protein
MIVVSLANYIGQKTIHLCSMLGYFCLFLGNAVKILFSTPPQLEKIIAQMYQIGVESFNIVALTGSFTGMVFALQSYIGFQRVGGEQFIGAVVALGMVRELGPVLTGLMVTGRAGSAITAEIGSMRISEQIDALSTLQINPIRYLVIPRILAGIIILPCLAVFAMMFGILGGYLVCVHILELSPEDYVQSIRAYAELSDITGGLIKSCVFGLIMTWVGTYKGFFTNGGARGVGRATTQSVVTSSILILVTNYFLTKLLEHL